MKFTPFRIGINLILGLASLAAFAQPLTLEKIMSGQDFVGYWPENPRWKQNENGFLYEHRVLGDSVSRTWCYDVKNGKTRLATATDLSEVLPFLVWNPSFSKALYTKKGNVYVWNEISKSGQLVLDLESPCSNPQWVEGGFAFQCDQSIYVFQNQQLQVLGKFGDERKASPSNDLTAKNEWLKNQQKELFLVLQDRARNQKLSKTAQINESNITSGLFPLGGKNLENWNISWDAKQLIYVCSSNNTDADETSMPVWITESGYVKTQPARAKVGEKIGEGFLHWATLDQGKWSYSVFNDTLTGQCSHPKELAIKDRASKKAVQFFGLYRSPIGNQFVVEVQSNDNKDRWIGIWKNGKFVELNHQHDDAWIGGPGISSWRSGDSDFGWFDAKNIFYQSEKTGYSHLYLQDVETGQVKALTSGNFEVMNLQFSPQKKVFFANMNREEPGRFLPGKIDPKLPLGWVSLLPPKKLFGKDPGFTEIFPSPSGDQFAFRFSTMEQPWELAVQEKGKMIWNIITRSTSPEFEKYSWNKGKVISFPGMDGKLVYARLYQPEKAVKNSAAVIFVHGAGYLQNAHHWWSNYYREFMFHHFLTERGYTVLDIDYRASSGYGRDWRTAIYRHMGGWDLNDHLSGRSYLVEQMGINPKKVGMYGGSYGGFMTLMALFTTPDSFACGAALRSVTDWAHYNHGYTSNILNTPETDSLSYAQSSPINFAKNLKNPLLMLHGMVDDNVQFQDIVRLSQRLIELEKDQWELAVYPVENHGFKERSSWLDEYKRIFKLFEQHLLH